MNLWMLVHRVGSDGFGCPWYFFEPEVVLVRRLQRGRTTEKIAQVPKSPRARGDVYLSLGKCLSKSADSEFFCSNVTSELIYDKIGLPD